MRTYKRYTVSYKLSLKSASYKAGYRNAFITRPIRKHIYITHMAKSAFIFTTLKAAKRNQELLHNYGYDTVTIHTEIKNKRDYNNV